MGRKSIARIRRKQIIEGFYQVVAEKGFASASVHEIEDAAGVSKGVLHHYFANKEAMVLGVMEYLITSYTAEFREKVLKHKSATERLKFLFSWFLDLDRFDMKFSRAWMEFWVLSMTHPAISKAFHECYAAVKQTVAGIIRDGIKSGEFRKVDVDTMAAMMLQGLEGATVLWVVDTKGTPIKKTGRAHARMFLEYLTPPATRCGIAER